MDGILPAYSYFYTIIKIAIQAIKFPNAPLAKQVHTIKIDLIGSRMSAKTVQVLRFLIEAGIIAKQEDINIGTAIIRLEPKGAEETYDELLGVAEDIYKIEINRNNANSTKRKLRVGNNEIRAIGVMSNRKRKTPKLGLARNGVNKDIQINFYEEATEFPSEKLLSLIDQSLGGAKFNIKFRVANPWVLSMFYVKSVNRFLPFDEKTLREKGEQFKVAHNKTTKTMRYVHITNHRINGFLSEAQHQDLYDTWNISETLARVADLGMPGVAEGLVYAPLLDKLDVPKKNARREEFRGGLDWGTSTNEGGSSTALLLGSITKHYQEIQIEKEYYHSNVKQAYKTDVQIVEDILDSIMEFIKDNLDKIQETTNSVVIYYDYGAGALQGLLNTALSMRRNRRIANMITFMPCFKYDVPVRIDIVKYIMGQQRYRVNPKTCPMHWEELEGCMYDISRVVKGRPTRLNEDDHTLDAMDYFIGKDLYTFADTRYLALNKFV